MLGEEEEEEGEEFEEGDEEEVDDDAEGLRESGGDDDDGDGDGDEYEEDEGEVSSNVLDESTVDAADRYEKDAASSLQRKE